jgi:hypothetical protein
MPSFALGKELAGLGGVLNRFVAAPVTGLALFNQGQPGSTLEKALQSIPSTKNTDAGRAAWNELQYMGGQITQGRMPYSKPASATRQVGQQAVLGGQPVYWGGDNYGWQQLNQTGSSATLNSLNTPGTQSQFIQDSLSASPAGASPVRGPGASSFTPLDPYAAQNREYERERARVEAMVKANPDMQKQAIADERAKVRDQGMAIWAQKNPTLAAKVQPGAVGYDTIQQALLGKEAGQAAAQAFGYQVPQQVVMTAPPGVDSPQGMPAVQSIEPTETYGAQRLQIDPEMVKRFQSVLNLTTK